MSGDDNRGPWADVLDQVREALDDAGVGAGEVRDELVRGVKDALHTLQGRPDEPPQGQDPPAASPDVTIVPGGRADDAPPAPGSPPDLRVAPPESAATPVSPSVSVSVRRARAPTALSPTDLSATGVFSVPADGSTQTLFRSDRAHPYRVVCDSGGLRISLDGAPADSLVCGQSMDVYARLVRVRADHDDGATGRYVRLPA